ncbi:MAG: preprotein translocase subunit SecE [Oscillospiraceae bacterium]|nr:preprotein translocase subunit SecE [Oscillospiraceae bacterium]
MAAETKNAKPVKLDKNGKEKMKLGERIKKFLRDYKSEMKKIVWPTRTQVIQNTGVVIFAIMFIAAIVGILDLAFGTGIISLLGGIRELIQS